MKAEIFGKHLRNLRKKRNLTIRQVELLSGVSNSYLSQVETGKRGIPSSDTLKKLAPVLRVSYEELMIAAGYLHNGNDLPPDAIPIGPTTRIPVLGTISAGLPLYAEQNIIEYVDVPVDEIKGGEFLGI